MTTSALLAEFETLSDSQRLSRMRDLGRRAAVEPDAASVIAAFEGGGFYERRLALHSCFTSRDGAHVLRALADPSRMVRGMAVVLAPIACDAAQMVQGFHLLGFQGQKSLLRGLAKWKRHDVFDAFITSLPLDDERRVRLLPFGSAKTIEAELHAVQEQMGEDDWRLMARTHPNIAIDRLQKRAEAATQLDPRLLSHVSAAFPNLVLSQSHTLTPLIQSLLQHAPPSKLSFDGFGQHRPQEAAALALATDGEANIRLESGIRLLDDASLLELARRWSDDSERARFWLVHLSPKQRAQVYAAVGTAWRYRDSVTNAVALRLFPGERRTEGAISPSILKLLPSAPRAAEARRCLRLPALATRPVQQFWYAALLPWDEARAALDALIRDPDPDLRAGALPALISTARYEPSHLADALALVQARSNEQDPIRLAMLTALAALPPSRWTAEHLGGFDQIFRDALTAADRSPGTSAAAEAIVIKLLPLHLDWASAWLATLLRESGQLYCRNLDTRLSDADVQNLAPALLPVLEAWKTRERSPHLIQIAQRFGRRLRVFHGLAALLEDIVHDKRCEERSVQALALLREHRRFRIHSLIPELIRMDASWITREPVYNYVHRRRQDLIAPFLGQQTYTGRFATGKTRIVLPFTSGFWRWTPRQQEIFATTLGKVARDDERDTFGRIYAIGQLAALPDIDPVILIALAAPGEQSALRDIALRALARRDAGDGVETLTEALGDNRARIAIYALRAALREMTPERALAVLRAAPLEKVTVAKEVIRLTGEIPSEEAYQMLIEFERRDLHRDARVALLRAFWDHLEREETWPILFEAAESPDPAIAGGVARIPTNRLSDTAQRRLMSLIVTLLGHAQPRLRLNVLGRCVSLPLQDKERTLFPRLLELLSSPLPDERTAAAQAVFATYTRDSAALVGEAIGRIRPDRRALRSALSALTASLIMSPGYLSAAALSAIEALRADPLTIGFRIELGRHALSASEFAALLTDAAESGELHADALAKAEQVIGNGTPYSRRRDAAYITTLEATLGDASDERLRRLGLSALAALSETPRGWDEAILARLREYRSDPSALVASAAQFTLPAAELEEAGGDKEQAAV